MLFSLLVLTALFVSIAAIVLSGFEVGLRLGRWRSAKPDPEPPLAARMIISSVLSLLAFILGFMFNIAAVHFDSRNDAFSEEAAAVASAYRRADLLAEPSRGQLRHLLREYLDQRVASENSSDTHQIAGKLQQLQDDMWAQAVVSRKAEGSDPPATVLQSLNELTASSDRVLKAMDSHLPGTVWVLLSAMTLVAVIAAGYHSGLGGARRRSIAALAYTLAFSAVLAMVVDADSPSLGQVQESRNALIDLRARISTAP